MRFFLTGPRIMGIRPGILFRADDLFKKPAPCTPSQGGFIYVISGDNGTVKVGVSNDPNARLANLQTAASVPLTLAYAGGLRCDGFAIEAAAHETLANYRLTGEWFKCPVDMAVAAIGAAAYRLGEPIASIDPADVGKVVQAVAASNQSIRGPSSSGWYPFLIGFVGSLIALIYFVYFT